MGIIILKKLGDRYIMAIALCYVINQANVVTARCLEK